MAMVVDGDRYSPSVYPLRTFIVGYLTLCRMGN